MYHVLTENINPSPVKLEAISAESQEKTEVSAVLCLAFVLETPNGI